MVLGDLTATEVTSVSAAEKAEAPTAPADVFDYDAHMNHFAKRIALGCVMPVLGSAIAMMFFAMSPTTEIGPDLLPENVAAALGCLCVFAGVALCLMLTIPAGMEHSSFVKAHPFIEDFYTEKQKEHARKTFTYELVGGIVVICLGICLMLFFANTAYEVLLGIPCLLVAITLGVYLIIRGGMLLSKVNIDSYNMAAAEVKASMSAERAQAAIEEAWSGGSNSKVGKRIGSVCGTIMLVATIVALVMLFVPQYFSPFFWLAWPIGALLCAIAALLMKGFMSDDD